MMSQENNCHIMICKNAHTYTEKYHIHAYKNIQIMDQSITPTDSHLRPARHTRPAHH